MTTQLDDLCERMKGLGFEVRIDQDRQGGYIYAEDGILIYVLPDGLWCLYAAQGDLEDAYDSPDEALEAMQKIPGMADRLLVRRWRPVVEAAAKAIAVWKRYKGPHTSREHQRIWYDLWMTTDELADAVAVLKDGAEQQKDETVGDALSSRRFRVAYEGDWGMEGKDA